MVAPLCPSFNRPQLLDVVCSTNSPDATSRAPSLTVGFNLSALSGTVLGSDPQPSRPRGSRPHPTPGCLSGLSGMGRGSLLSQPGPVPHGKGSLGRFGSRPPTSPVSFPHKGVWCSSRFSSPTFLRGSRVFTPPPFPLPIRSLLCFGPRTSAPGRGRGGPRCATVRKECQRAGRASAPQDTSRAAARLCEGGTR